MRLLSKLLPAPGRWGRGSCSEHTAWGGHSCAHPRCSGARVGIRTLNLGIKSLAGARSAPGSRIPRRMAGVDVRRSRSAPTVVKIVVRRQPLADAPGATR